MDRIELIGMYRKMIADTHNVHAVFGGGRTSGWAGLYDLLSDWQQELSKENNQ